MPEDDTTQNQGGQQQQQQDGTPPTPPAGGDNADEGKVVTTQAALDAQFAQRGREGGQAAINKLLDQLGVPSVEDLTGIVTTLREVQDQQKSENQKLQEQLDQAKQAAQTASAQAKETLIRAEFVRLGVEAGVKNPDDAYLLADRSSIEVNDVGAVTGVKEQIEKLVEEKRVVMREQDPAPSTQAGAGQQSRGGESVRLTDEEKAMASRMGLSTEAYLKGKKQDATIADYQVKAQEK
jgi:hypothetical protein